MMQAPDLPFWAAFLVALLVVAGAAFTLIGSVGLLRLGSFYERVHPPTLGSTLGAVLIILGSILCFSVLRSRPIIHEVLIVGFVALTTPVSLLLLARAALYRDRLEGRDDIPPPEPREQQEDKA